MGTETVQDILQAAQTTVLELKYLTTMLSVSVAVTVMN